MGATPDEQIGTIGNQKYLCYVRNQQMAASKLTKWAKFDIKLVTAV